MNVRFVLITGKTLIDNSHIGNTVRSPFAHYACRGSARPFTALALGNTRVDVSRGTGRTD